MHHSWLQLSHSKRLQSWFKAMNAIGRRRRASMEIALSRIPQATGLYSGQRSVGQTTSVSICFQSFVCPASIPRVRVSDLIDRKLEETIQTDAWHRLGHQQRRLSTKFVSRTSLHLAWRWASWTQWLNQLWCTSDPRWTASSMQSISIKDAHLSMQEKLENLNIYIFIYQCSAVSDFLISTLIQNRQVAMSQWHLQNPASEVFSRAFQHPFLFSVTSETDTKLLLKVISGSPQSYTRLQSSLQIGLTTPHQSKEGLRMLGLCLKNSIQSYQKITSLSSM